METGHRLGTPEVQAPGTEQLQLSMSEPVYNPVHGAGCCTEWDSDNAVRFQQATGQMP